MDLKNNFVDNEDDIVISGIAGRFPESDNMDELRDNLYANRDLITEDDRRWPLGLYGLPTRSGKLKELNKFDAQFFGISGKQVEYMDPQGRILIEVTYEAIVDSGWNPSSIRGTNTGVFIGSFLTEAEESLASNPHTISGYGAIGTKRNMLANRVSFVFDLKGPSMSIDSACSSSLAAFQLAYSGLRTNQFESAIVGGVNINLRPNTALEFNRLQLLSTDGKCKYLDASANGYVRSETVSAVVLQKRKNAKRVYATVIHAKTNSDGNKVQGITYPSTHSQIQLMESTLKESGVNPNWIQYIESHGTGTQAGDLNESNSIFEVYCKDRIEPLLVGSVKTNLGHTEASSGMCSLAKMVITLENRKIPAILHLKERNPNIRPLIEGSIQAVTENRDFEDSVVAINSFGFGGTNVHILIRPNSWPCVEDRDKHQLQIPRLIVVKGRTEESVNYILDFIRKNPNKASDDFLSLLSDVTTDGDTNGMEYHGFMILDVSEHNFVELESKVAKVGPKRQVWFLLSGMGSQWTGMAEGLMDIEIFNKSIRQSAEVLEPFGIDLFELLLGDSEDRLVQIYLVSVGLAAVQIALVDVMKAIDIIPDGFVGHSSGELVCGYLDEALNAREMLLYAYWRGLCVQQAELPKGLMAAVGLSWEEAQRRCPPGVVAACNNGIDSVTISGAFEKVEEFINQLKSENIFAKKVNSCDIPAHSPYMKAIAPVMLERMKSVNNSKRLRSSRWISSSVPESNWSEPEAKYSNAEYYVNNLTSPVLFLEALRYIPDNAIVIEIAPDSLFKNLTKRSLSPNCNYIGLMKRKNWSNNVSHLLTSIGQMFNLGLKPKIQNLYPKVEYPVKRGTQSLGSLIRWDHTEDWLVTLYPNYFNTKSQSEISVEIDLTKDENQYYFDHCVDERALFPGTGYLYLVWDEFARQLGKPRDQLPIIFENIRFLRAIIMNKESVLKFKLNLSEMDGDFQLYENDFLTVTGHIRTPRHNDNFLALQHKLERMSPSLSDDNYLMHKQDVYKELWIRGYHFGRHFQNILSIDIHNSRANIQYNNNWITFLDSMIQFLIFHIPTRDLLLQTSIKSIYCDPRILISATEQGYSEVVANLSANYCLSKGLEVYGLDCTQVMRNKSTHELVLEKYVWIPYMDSCAFGTDMQQLITTYLQVIEDMTENETKKQNTVHKNRLNKLLAINGFNSEKLLLKEFIENLNTNQLKENINEFIETNDKKLSKDLLNNLYLEESLLRPALDIVLENTCFQLKPELNSLEINLNQEICYKNIIQYINDSFHDLKINYSVYNPFYNSYSGENSYQEIDLNFSSSADFRAFNLVIIRDQFPSKGDNPMPSYEQIFGFVDSNLKINGFLVFLKRNEFTKYEKSLFTRFGYKYDCIPDINQLISMADKIGLSLVSNRSDSMTSSVLLFRKMDRHEDKDDVVIKVDHLELNSWFETLKNELNSDPNDESLIWLVSDCKNLSGIVGFVKCLRREPGGHRIRCISDMIPTRSLSIQELIDSSIIDNKLVMNVYKNSKLGSYRHLSLNEERLTKSEVKHAMIVSSKGTDSSMYEWFEAKHNLWPKLSFNNQQNILIHVFYAGLNVCDLYRDSADTSDMFRFYSRFNNSPKGLCSEFSGVDELGNRYIGIKPKACLSTTLVFNNRDDLIQIPDDWPLEQACSVPVSYGTAYFALIVKAQIHKNQTILIHAGDGCIGRAAIAIAQSYECKVYTTVGSVESKTQLLNEFPDLDENKVINTSIDFFKEIISDGTDGKGVDIVFNYTNDYQLETSLFCVQQNGRFIEIGNNFNEMVGKGLSTDKNISIDKINFDRIFSETTEQLSEESIIIRHKKQILRLIKEGINDKVVKPFISQVFSSENISQAMDCLSNNGNKQKVLIRIRAEDLSGKGGMKNDLLISAKHSTQFQTNRSYVITGGLGGFGLELANWMVEKGAKHLVLTSRTGVKTTFQRFNIERLRRLGAQVVVSTLSAAKQEECKELIVSAKRIAPVGGIFSLAMVLSDGIFENQTQESMQKVLEPKILENLDQISRELCPELQYFVAFSSVSSGRGNGGQTNYGFANSSMESLCEMRRELGLPALAVQWGAVADVGAIVNRFGTEGTNDVIVGRTLPQRIHSCLSVLNDFLNSTDTIVSSLLRNRTKIAEKDGKRDIISIICDILGIRDVSKISHSSKLHELGMDSLMVIEIKQSLEMELQLSLTLKQLNGLTFGEIIEMNIK